MLLAMADFLFLGPLFVVDFQMIALANCCAHANFVLASNVIAAVTHCSVPHLLLISLSHRCKRFRQWGGMVLCNPNVSNGTRYWRLLHKGGGRLWTRSFGGWSARPRLRGSILCIWHAKQKLKVWHARHAGGTGRDMQECWRGLVGNGMTTLLFLETTHFFWRCSLF